MLTQADIKAMAETVARAIHAAAAPEGEAWDGLEDDDRAQFLALAHVAMGAHDGWLFTNGFVVTRPPPPKKHAALVTPPTPKLILAR